ncbi:MAG TPA: LPS export ABC transporter periplasmic protein LptC [Chitinispirillaceae bacterium]|nr:LPS export ABC transporter periplasmic protein LptC [Chitinispirillaceae bacterium]
MFNRNIFFRNLPIIFLSLLLFATGCTQKKESLPMADAEILVPYQEFTNSTIHFYTKNYMQWKLQSKFMRKPITDTGVITLVPVRMTFYDSVGVVKSLIIGDSCIIRNQMESYTIWGDVYIRTRDSMEVRSHKLNWYRDRKKVLSDTFVQIVTKKGDRLRGKGLDATEDFSRFSFNSDVKGRFPDFKRRVENEEEGVF